MLKRRDSKILQIDNKIMWEKWSQTSANDWVNTHKNIATISNLPSQRPSQPREGMKKTIPNNRGTSYRESFGPKPTFQS